MSEWNGGSPVSSTSNPYNKGAGLDPQDILGGVDVDAKEAAVMDDLDAYNSEPIIDDAAAQRPLNPPTVVP